MAVQKKALFADRLRGMQDAASAAMANYTPGGVKVPDAVYNCRQGCEMSETQAGKLKIARTFTIVEGEYTGLNIWDGLVLEGNEVGIQIARRWVELHQEQWPENDLAELENIVNRINAANLIVSVRSKTSGDFTNVSVNKILSEGAAPTPPPPAAPKPAVVVAPKPVAPKPAMPPVPSLQATNVALKKGITSVTAPKPPVEVIPPTPVGADVDQLSAMNRAELKAFISHGNLPVRVTLKMTDDDIRTEIRKHTAVNAAETAVGIVDQKQLTRALCVLCASQGVEGVTDGMSPDEIAEVMSGYQFARAELTEEEVALLNQVGVGGQIV